MSPSHSSEAGIARSYIAIAVPFFPQIDAIQGLEPFLRDGRIRMEQPSVPKYHSAFHLRDAGSRCGREGCSQVLDLVRVMHENDDPKRITFDEAV